MPHPFFPDGARNNAPSNPGSRSPFTIAIGSSGYRCVEYSRATSGTFTGNLSAPNAVLSKTERSFAQRVGDQLAATSRRPISPPFAEFCPSSSGPCGDISERRHRPWHPLRQPSPLGRADILLSPQAPLQSWRSFPQRGGAGFCSQVPRCSSCSNLSIRPVFQGYIPSSSVVL